MRTLFRTAAWGLGPAAALALWLAPLQPALTPAAHALAGIMAWVVGWWIFEPIPLAGTSLLGVTLAVLLKATPSAEAAFGAFGHPLIFLFFGGFVLARAMQVHGLDRRLALWILSRPSVAGRPRRTVAALIFTTGFLSLWISNTASTAMMLPIALGLLAMLAPAAQKMPGMPDIEDAHLAESRRRARAAILIGVAYAASLGGLGTPVGSPPNIILLGMLDKLAGVRIGFLQWMVFAIPAVAAALGVLLALVFAFIPRGALQPIDAGEIRRQYGALGPMTRGERNTLLAALTAVFLWMSPEVFARLAPDWGADYRARMPESVPAVVAMLLLMILPARRVADLAAPPAEMGDSPAPRGSAAPRFHHPTLEWREVVDVDWNSLLLFGGGLSLGAMIFQTGLAAVLGNGIIATFGGANPWAFAAVALIFSVVMSETLSNTAAANMLIPLLIAAAQAGAPGEATAMNAALIPAVATAIGCSLGFMLPVATPPNAIVYGTGQIRVGEMLRMGFLMDVLGSALALVALAVLSRLV